MSDSERRVLVVGMGVSGIATAIRLRQIGWTPVLVEKSATRRSGGYFIGLFGAGKAAARRLGVLDGLHDRTSHESVTFDIDRMGNRRLGIGFKDLPGRPWLMLRGDVERAAYAALPEDVEIRYSTVPTRIEQDVDGVDVTLHDTVADTTTTERFALVVGADGLRSTVRALAFGSHERYLRRLDHMIAAFQLPAALPGLAARDGVFLMERERSMWVLPFVDHPPTVLMGYRTENVDAEFSAPPIERLRAVFGPEPTGRILGQVLDAWEVADDPLFDSVEQVHLDRWYRGRVVLVGDSAWCVTLYAGMGVSAGLCGADLLGTMLARHPDDLETALGAWDRTLRPYFEYFQRNAIRERAIFNPHGRVEIGVRRLVARVQQSRLGAGLLRVLQDNAKATRLKSRDIARAG